MITRPVKAEDEEQVFEILKEAMSEQYIPMMREEFRKILDKQYRGFVAEENDKILGYVCARPVVETYKLETIAVDQNIRSKGIGSSLVSIVEDCARQDGKKVLTVDTDSSDIKTVSFYLKNNFKIAGYVNSEYIADVTQVHLMKKVE